MVMFALTVKQKLPLLYYKNFYVYSAVYSTNEYNFHLNYSKN